VKACKVLVEFAGLALEAESFLKKRPGTGGAEWTAEFQGMILPGMGCKDVLPEETCKRGVK